MAKTVQRADLVQSVREAHGIVNTAIPLGDAIIGVEDEPIRQDRTELRKIAFAKLLDFLLEYDVE